MYFYECFHLIYNIKLGLFIVFSALTLHFTLKHGLVIARRIDINDITHVSIKLDYIMCK